MKFSKVQNYLLVVLFSGFLGFNFLLNSTGAINAGKIFIQETRAQDIAEVDFSIFEDEYNSYYSTDSHWIDLYGLTNRILGKREVSGFEVIRDYDNNLYIPEDPIIDNKDTTECIESIRLLSEKAKEVNASFLFVQAPYKNYSGIPELEGYGSSYLNENYDETLHALNQYEILTVDLRLEKDCCQWYRTDHHWTGDAAFTAAGTIIQSLEDNFSLDFSFQSSKYSDSSQYERFLYEESFLGSCGIKVGKLYAGKDDFSYLSPLFETDFSFLHYVNGELSGSFEGPFQDVFIDDEILEDEKYYNKYNSFLRGAYVESIIKNNTSINDKKVLFIGHSYGRPLVPYLSLYFAETRYLDPQEGRYNENYLSYIDEYKPDIIIVMYNDKISTE